MRRLRPESALGGGLAVFAVLVAGWSLVSTVHAQAAPGGKELFEKRCGGCHALDADREGPRLRGVVGRRAGSVESFQYSDALPKSGITWNAELLDRWLTDPDKLIKDNDMAFHVENAEERRAIIGYLAANPAR